jgi:Phage integrase, N-terminal SAM-like domain
MTDEVISPLRQRMIEDMTIRRLVSKTQQGYIRNVKAFAAFLGRSPGTANREDVRRFQLHLTSSGAGHAKDQQHRDGAAVLLRCDARSTRHREAFVVRVRAAQATDRLEPRGGRALSGGGAGHQVQGGAECRLRQDCASPRSSRSRYRISTPSA